MAVPWALLKTLLLEPGPAWALGKKIKLLCFCA